MRDAWRHFAAEFIGTFALMFVAGASIMAGQQSHSPDVLLHTAIAQGVILALMITATMRISGHLNPAVTIGLLVARRTTVVTAAAYIAAQLIAAVLAAFLLQTVYPIGVTRAVSLGAPVVASSITLGQAIGIETILTFFLVSAVFGTCVNPEAPKVGGFGIGLVLVFDILVGGPLTGAAMNPARAFGPALVSGQWIGHVVYWVGPLAGGILAALLWQHVLLPRTPALRRRKTD